MVFHPAEEEMGIRTSAGKWAEVEIVIFNKISNECFLSYEKLDFLENMEADGVTTWKAGVREKDNTNRLNSHKTHFIQVQKYHNETHHFIQLVYAKETRCAQGYLCRVTMRNFLLARS